MSECVCRQEIGRLNSDIAEWCNVEVNIINPMHEEGGYLRIVAKDHEYNDTIRINFCPLCGRPLAKTFTFGAFNYD